MYNVPCSRVLHYAAERSPMNHGDRKKAEHYLHNAGLIIKVQIGLPLILTQMTSYSEFKAAGQR